jgi:hypothetical protein
MSETEHPPSGGNLDISDERARAVDEAGRRAGAALRSPAPAYGAAAIQGRAHRRRAVRVAATTAGVSVLLVAGVMAFQRDGGSVEPQPADTPPDTGSFAPNSTSVPSTIQPSDSLAPSSTPAPSTIQPTDSLAPSSTSAPSTIQPTTSPSFPGAQSLEVAEVGTLFGSLTPRFSADGSLLAVESTLDEVVIHEAATLTELRRLPCPTSLESIPDSAGTAPSPDYVWDVEAGSAWDADTLTFLASVSRPLLCNVAVTAGGSRAVTEADVQADARFGGGGSLLWDTSDGSLVAVIPGFLAGFTADGSRMIMSDGPSVSVVETSTGAVVTTITDDRSGTVVSPDGTRLLRVGGSGPVVYDTQTLTPIATLSAGASGEITGFEDPVFDDTSRRVAALETSGVTIWDSTTGAQLQRLPVELAPNGRSVTFSPGGLMIAVRNGTHLMILDSSSGVELADLALDTILEEMVFSPDDVRVAVAAIEDVVRVWSYARN